MEADDLLEAADELLSSFFPCSSPSGLPPPPALRRCLLLSRPHAGRSSLLFQMALNRVRRGSPALYIHCGPRAALPGDQPTRPRLPTPDSEYSLDDEAARAHDEQERKLLRMIHIKYATTWAELREVLKDLHLPAARPAGANQLPNTIIVDGLPSLATPASASDSAIGAAVAPSPMPSPGKPAAQNAGMYTALGLALAAHAADLLDASSPPAPPAALPTDAADGILPASATGNSTGSAAAPCEPAMLVVACQSPGPEGELASRWLPTQLRIEPLACPPTTSRRAAAARRLFTLRACRGGAIDDELSRVEYAHTAGRPLEMLGVEEVASFGHSPFHRSPLSGGRRQTTQQRGTGCSSSSGGVPLPPQWTPSAMGGVARRLSGAEPVATNGSSDGGQPLASAVY